MPKLFLLPALVYDDIMEIEEEYSVHSEGSSGETIDLSEDEEEGGEDA